jgi:nucleotidyltransferase substrate binding protein (TIGR01987 family)
MDSDIRWKRRFQNFDRAFVLLRGALANGPDALNRLEIEGVIQRFGYSFELAWKTVKDFLQENGIVFDIVTPKSVLKEGFAAKVINDGQVWIDMLNHRNLLAHTYNFENFQKAVEAIVQHDLPAMGQLHEFFLDENHP